MVGTHHLLLCCMLDLFKSVHARESVQEGGDLADYSVHCPYPGTESKHIREETISEKTLV